MSRARRKAVCLYQITPVVIRSAPVISAKFMFFSTKRRPVGYILGRLGHKKRPALDVLLADTFAAGILPVNVLFVEVFFLVEAISFPEKRTVRIHADHLRRSATDWPPGLFDIRSMYLVLAIG